MPGQLLHFVISGLTAPSSNSRTASGNDFICVADINDTAAIHALFAELPAVDHVYIAAGSTKIGSPLDHPLYQFRQKFDERLWGSS